MSIPDIAAVARVVDGPVRIGSEQRWRVELEDGSAGVVARLLPELAREGSVRRRWLRDVERLRALDVPSFARVLAMGPAPDDGSPPWRLRADPPGETLERWLERRAPAPIDEACALLARLSEAVATVHAAGFVLRDLTPRVCVLGPDGAITLTDVGLARVDLLSSRTRNSLVLEGSPYAAPEQVRRTALDPRTDVFTLGAILFEAVTGVRPFGDAPAFMRPAVPRASRLRPDVPADLDALLDRALHDDPEARPEGALAFAAALRGEAPGQRTLQRVTCQGCGAALRPGQRLCLACGKQAVQFEHAPAGATDVVALELRKVLEDAAFFDRLRSVLGSVSEGPLPALNFLVGDARMYSKEEQKRLLRLPVVLFERLERATAERLLARMKEARIDARIVPTRSTGVAKAPAGRKRVLGVGAVAATAVAGGLVLVGAPVWALPLLGAVFLVFAIITLAVFRQRTAKGPFSLLRLRSAPAALPASDPWVARLAAALHEGAAADVREQVGELALLVQRLVDHRATHARERAEIDLVTAPIPRLVELIEAEVRKLARIDAELAELDEGALVRALAVGEARGEPTEVQSATLARLDRLRTLEDARGRAFHRLLEAGRLLRRSVELGLAVRDADVVQAAEVRHALAVLDGE